MKKEDDQSKDDVNIRSIVEKIEKIELIDALDSVGGIKDDVAVPYLIGLFEDLLLRSDAPDKGIPRVVLIDVFLLSSSVVFEFARSHRRKVFHPF